MFCFLLQSSKTLTLLAEFSKVDVYRGFNWRKKMRSPSDFCFALKEPKLQKKSKDIKYFCVDDEYQLKKWLMNLRIAKVNTREKLTSLCVCNVIKFLKCNQVHVI